jgi:hypothetical protein
MEWELAMAPRSFSRAGLQKHARARLAFIGEWKLTGAHSPPCWRAQQQAHSEQACARDSRWQCFGQLACTTWSPLITQSSLISLPN